MAWPPQWIGRQGSVALRKGQSNCYQEARVWAELAASGWQQVQSNCWLQWKMTLRLCDTIIWVFTTKALKWALFDQKIRNKLGAGGRAKFKCNCSHCFALRWMVGRSHYSPSTDMLPRVIWQLAKINHNQDGGRHCHRESVALGANSVGVSAHTSPAGQRQRGKGGPGERKTEERQ